MSIVLCVAALWLIVGFGIDVLMRYDSCGDKEFDKVPTLFVMVIWPFVFILSGPSYLSVAIVAYIKGRR